MKLVGSILQVKKICKKESESLTDAAGGGRVEVGTSVAGSLETACTAAIVRTSFAAARTVYDINTYYVHARIQCHGNSLKLKRLRLYVTKNFSSRVVDECLARKLLLVVSIISFFSFLCFVSVSLCCYYGFMPEIKIYIHTLQENH